MPFEVPSTIDAETDIHVGVPKLRLPTSEKACPFSFLSFVHLTTSQGGEGVSVSPVSLRNWLFIDNWRECGLKELGDDARGTLREEIERRVENRLSNGRNDGVGLSRPGLEATDGRILLPAGEDSMEPCQSLVTCPYPRPIVLPE
jgi:hypothetical protein